MFYTWYKLLLGNWFTLNAAPHLPMMIIGVSSKDIVLGIDFGTSFTTAAAWFNGRMHLVPDHRGEPCIPSIVNFNRRRAPVVGAAALELRMRDPANTVSSVKRLLGRPYDSNEVRIFDAHNAVPTKPGDDGSARLLTQAGDITPQEVASRVFSHVRSLAEQQFQGTIRKAVITVPACATSKSQKATVSAARDAGLDVVQVLSEPAAGAVANRLDQLEGNRRILVYDFGGGTFDVTILEQRDGAFSTRALSGDSCLGGDDFDHALAGLISGFMWKANRFDITKDAVRWDRLVHACENTKRALSALQMAPVRLHQAYRKRGKTEDLDIVLARTDVEPTWATLVERSIRITAETMRAANARPDDIDVVLLIGGTTFIPLVRRQVARIMKKPGLHEGDAQTAVARGAALIGARMLRVAA